MVNPKLISAVAVRTQAIKVRSWAILVRSTASAVDVGAESLKATTSLRQVFLKAILRSHYPNYDYEMWPIRNRAESRVK